jgi:hypothetical protein
MKLIIKKKVNTYQIQSMDDDGLVRYLIHIRKHNPPTKIFGLTLRKGYKYWETMGYYGPNWDEYLDDFRPHIFKSLKKAKKFLKDRV